ncbi:hypothetical protein [Kordiimonas pumila]|uniref:Secreted protein n=1 Tax=Kordiimonas pumila TaxID=2161677 RepID=A0ABV7D9I0_9PROT|nr:hypothetical protein [Kordiimonas pumila]
MKLKITSTVSLLCAILVTPIVHAGEWRTGKGATIENALLEAIDKLNNKSGIICIDRRTKSFKTICKSNGPLYSVRMHGNYHKCDGDDPDTAWIKREASKLQLQAKVCTN